MERSFAKEIENLRLGDGDTFHGEGVSAKELCGVCRQDILFPFLAADDA